MSDILSTYTIYRDALDVPGAEFVVRQFVIIGGTREPQAGEILGTAATLEAARELVPPAADVCMDRHPDDDRAIVETWI